MWLLRERGLLQRSQRYPGHEERTCSEFPLLLKGFTCFVDSAPFHPHKNLVQRTEQILSHYRDKAVAAQGAWAAQPGKQEREESNPSLLVVKFTFF